ncbi:glycosyltransferase [Acidimicrobiaceae bacterium USS-CC1]|uniref:4,4'-diaponeurosporenoate glycosyltransferase n=1 Tax=Acidiferrimicrobium australe TaxID=2664430 RepID=A0ABW9QTU3_9ACTN|nr:glycosyltransferase [Acidiferrimicrobium australe]
MTTVGIVVPTRNSARTLRACLLSLRAQTRPCSVVVVDNHSTDSTGAIAEELADRVLVRGPERSAQRNAGAALLGTDVVGFVDSDMVLEPSVVEEAAAAAVAAGAGAVIVPERTVGEGFWAAVRALERSFYVGDDRVEAARFFTRSVLDATGGFDESLDAGEDWDLSLRARRITSMARTSAGIDHLEGRLTYRAACAKKAAYSSGLRSFHAKHDSATLWRALDRPYLRRPWRLLTPDPLLGAGVLALKAGEAAAVVWALTRDGSRRRAATTPAVTHEEHPR